MLKSVALGMVIALATAQGAASADLNVKINVPGYTEKDAEAVIDLFRQNCRPLGDAFWSDVTKVEATFGEEYADYRQAHGWRNSLLLQLHYSEDPQDGPTVATGPGVLAGQTLYYVLGGGDEPGFFASKRASQYLCGLSFSGNGDDLFVSVPELGFLDR